MFYRYEPDGGMAFGNQTITFDQLLFFNSVKVLKCDGTIITHENGSMVKLETIVANFPKLEQCYFTIYSYSINISETTVKELLDVPHFSQMKMFILRGIPDTFDIEMFYNYLKGRNDLFCVLVFHPNISNEYFARLETIADELLSTETTSFQFPCFGIPNLDQNKTNELMNRCKNGLANL